MALTGLLSVACAHGVKPDVNTESTIADNDSTVLIIGCDKKPSVGSAFCRKSEGDSAYESIFIIVPPVKCDYLTEEKNGACVFIKIFNNEGTLVFGEGIKQGVTRLEIPWSKLLSNRNFELNDRGFWTVNETVYWLDNNGMERRVVAQGDIVLRVYRKGYLPLNNIDDDENFCWVWKDGEFTYKSTSSLRMTISSH